MMFAVPGWDISTKSLVTEKPEAKSKRRNDADPTHLKKRKRAQLDLEQSRTIDGTQLEQLWNQHFGPNGDQGGHAGRKSNKHDSSAQAHLSRGKLNDIQHANAGDRQHTGASTNSNNAFRTEEKLSRKQKKLHSKLKREHEGLDTTLNDKTLRHDQSPGKEEKHNNVGLEREQRAHNITQSATDNGAHFPAALVAGSSSQKDRKLNTEHKAEHDPASGGPEGSRRVPQRRASEGQTDPAFVGDYQRPRKDGKPSKSSAAATVNSNPPIPSTASPSSSTQALPPAPPPSTSKLTPLQSLFSAKLTSARFRHLNQQLYTTPSSDSLNLFTSQPSLFTDYHTGFTQSTLSWPINPVNVFISRLQTRQDLPRRKTGSCTVADLGCGDAPLARAVAPANKTKKLGLTIHSFDLHAANEHVTVADISKLPLRDGEADIAIFCLSLMGTNWIDFVEECWRILRGDGKGEVWVAEVKSRFGRVTRKKGEPVENSVGKKKKQAKSKKPEDEVEGVDDAVFAEDSKTMGPEETDISAFVQVFQRRGLELKEDSVDKSNKMFVSMVFHKTGVPTAGKHKGLKWTGREYQKQHDGKMKFTNHDNNEDSVDAKEEAKVLKPCVYKTR